MRYRFEAIEATFNWACTIVAIELAIHENVKGRIDVAATVQYYGSDFSDEPIAAVTCHMTGTCVEESSTTLAIEIDEPAPISRLVLDPSKQLVEYLFATAQSAKRNPLPSFWMPLLEWASANGLRWHMPLASI
jgi:hypothetical protein